MTLNRRILAIAVPMIISNLSIPLLGMVDAGVMGHLPEPVYLGAVAVGATIFNFLFLGLNFLRMGTTGVAAQAHGRDDAAGLRGALGQSVLLALSLAGVLLLLQWPLRELALQLILPSPEVAAQARAYFDVRIWSAPAVLVNYALLGWFLGLQNARVPLALLLIANTLNIILDFVFVVGLGMRTEGVALATVIAEYASTGAGVWFARRALLAYPGEWRRATLLDTVTLKRLIGINANIFLRTLSLMFAFAFFTAQGARGGDVILAANAILLSLQSFMAYGLDGFAHAVEALAGRAVGNGNRGEFRTVVRACLRWSLGTALVFALGYGAFGAAVVYLLTNLPEVRATALQYLPWMVLSPFVSVWPFLWDGVFIGATRAREMRDTMLISAFLIYLPAWWLLQPFGNHGLWAALMIFFAARGLTLGWVYRRTARHWFGREAAVPQRP